MSCGRDCRRCGAPILQPSALGVKLRATVTVLLAAGGIVIQCPGRKCGELYRVTRSATASRVPYALQPFEAPAPVLVDGAPLVRL